MVRMLRILLILSGLALGGWALFYRVSQPAPVLQSQSTEPASAKMEAPLATEDKPTSPKTYSQPKSAPQKPAAVQPNETPERRIARLKQALIKDPENAQLNAELGLTLARDMRAPQEGIPHLEKAIRINPGNGTMFYDLVGAYLESGNVERGSAFLEEIIKLDNGNTSAANAALGDLRAASGDPIGALPYVQRAHEADRDSPGVTALLASIYQQAGDVRAEETARLAEAQQQEKIRQLEAQGLNAELEKRVQEEIQKTQIDGYFKDGRTDKIEEMIGRTSGAVKEHAQSLLRQSEG